MNNNYSDSFIREMCNVISAHYPFPASDIYAVWRHVKSFDKLLELCHRACEYGYGDLNSAWLREKGK